MESLAEQSTALERVVTSATKVCEHAEMPNMPHQLHRYSTTAEVPTHLVEELRAALDDLTSIRLGGRNR